MRAESVASHLGPALCSEAVIWILSVYVNIYVGMPLQALCLHCLELKSLKKDVFHSTPSLSESGRYDSVFQVDSGEGPCWGPLLKDVPESCGLLSLVSLVG